MANLKKKPFECPMCDGQGGFQRIDSYDTYGDPTVEAEACQYCEGTGKTNGLKEAIFKAKARHF